jgi:ubiquitin-conjugating enzyme E2 H
LNNFHRVDNSFIINMQTSCAKHRIKTDVLKLIKNKHDVQIIRNEISEFYIKFHGPFGTPYQGGIWKILVKLPDDYPYKPPYVRFSNKIFHPNIEETSGIVCLDVINQTWTPMYDLTNVFDTFLPQLLTHPNAMDPLNSDAGILCIQRPEEFEKIVKSYVRQFAMKDARQALKRKMTDDADSDGSMSSLSGDEN